MKQNKLDCCVVRDLLPSYIENLTEPETSRQVAEHLEGCVDCRAQEQQMRTQLPMQPVSKKSLRFLKRARNNRIAAAILAIVAALLCMCLVYGHVFRYSNDEADLLNALEADLYDNPYCYLETGTPLQITARTDTGSYLLVSFIAKDAEKHRGYMELVRGINGKYCVYMVFVENTHSSAGVIGYNITLPNTSPLRQDYTLSYDNHFYDEHICVLSGYHCKDVDSVRVTLSSTENQAETVVEKDYPITETNFLQILDPSELEAIFPQAEEEEYIPYAGPYILNCALLDKDGNDITEQYAIDDGETNPYENQYYGMGKVNFMFLYQVMGVIGVIGVVIAVRILLKW
ncbi:MAG: zf-HC2 domain-containing protein [Eubacteriales bacterium]|nr:zf-HC2 domain-containing protein [Eubacteriales bacterium]